MRATRVLCVLASVVGAFMIVAGNALANNPGNGFQVSSAKATSTVKFSVKFNFIGTWVEAKQPLRKVKNRPVCYWAEGTWTNSVKVPVIRSYRETSRAYFCDLKKPVTVNGVTYTAVKKKGGKTGSPCDNLAIPPGRPQPKPQIRGPVLDVRSLANVVIAVKVNARANASVWGSIQCPGGAVGASATGTGAINGTIRIKISQTLLTRSRGRVNGAIRTYIEQQIRASVEGKATANATANISVSCGPAPPVVPPQQPPPVVPPVVPPPPPPANRPPTIRLECPAHVYSNADPNKTGRVVIWAYVSDPDGNPLTVGFARPQYGKYNGGSYPDGADPARFGSEYQAPVWTGPGDLMETITVTVNDGQGKSNSVATASCGFPIKPDDFG